MKCSLTQPDEYLKIELARVKRFGYWLGNYEPKVDTFGLLDQEDDLWPINWDMGNNDK